MLLKGKSSGIKGRERFGSVCRLVVGVYRLGVYMFKGKIYSLIGVIWLY